MRFKAQSFEEKINRLRQYRDAELRPELIRVFKANGATERTMDDWLSHPNENARYVKNGILDKILQDLPDLKILEHVNSYLFALKERNLDRSSQSFIKDYNGKYNIYSNIPSNLLRFNMMRLHYNEEIKFPVFKIRATFNDGVGISGPKICDGYFIVDGKYIIFTGMSKYFSTSMIAIKPVNNKTDIIKCTITVENRFSGSVYTSSGLILHEDCGILSDQSLIGSTYMYL